MLLDMKRILYQSCLCYSALVMSTAVLLGDFVPHTCALGFA